MEGVRHKAHFAVQSGRGDISEGLEVCLFWSQVHTFAQTHWTGNLKYSHINKVLLYSTGNYIQYPVVNNNGKEYKKECICITESLCCTPETNTTL